MGSARDHDAAGELESSEYSLAVSASTRSKPWHPSPGVCRGPLATRLGLARAQEPSGSEVGPLPGPYQPEYRGTGTSELEHYVRARPPHSIPRGRECGPDTVTGIMILVTRTVTAIMNLKSET
jgi:hypothetical protein